MSSLSDFRTGGGHTPKFEIITSSSGSWSKPTNIVGDMVWISAIAGGEAGTYSTGNRGASGGSYIVQQPFEVTGSTLAYTIGAGGTWVTGGEPGSDTTIDGGTITLLGADYYTSDAATGSIGNYALGADFTVLIPPGPYGSRRSSAGQDAFRGGAGLRFGDTVYGYGGCGQGAGVRDGGDGAILLEWLES